MEFPWFLVIVLGTVILGVAIAYGMMRNRQRTAREMARTEQATHNLYKKEDQAPGV